MPMNQLDLDTASLLLLLGDLDTEIYDKGTLKRFGISASRADAAYQKLVADGFMHDTQWRIVTDAGRKEQRRLKAMPPMNERDEQVLVALKDAPSYGVDSYDVTMLAVAQGLTKTQVVRSIGNLVRYGLMSRLAYGNTSYTTTVHGRHIAAQLS